MNYSVSYITNTVISVMNNSVTSDDTNVLNDDLYTIFKDKDDNIIMIDYNSVLVSDFLEKVTVKISEKLKELDSFDGIMKIPILSLFGNPILNNIGPTINVKVRSIGSINTSIYTDVKEYGINNSIIEMYILVEAKEQILLPVTSKVIDLSNKIPISYKIITGKVPSYYGSSLNKSSPIVSSLIN